MKLSRRSILKGVSALFVAGLAPSASRAALTAGRAKPEARNLLLNRFYIAGFQFYDGPKSVGRLAPGTALFLRAEPNNKHDPFAVEILFGKTKLGYVPRTDNKHISRLLEQSAKLECRVIAVNADALAWNMVKVEVCMI